jgi:hypothetical protein
MAMLSDAPSKPSVCGHYDRSARTASIGWLSHPAFMPDQIWRRSSPDRSCRACWDRSGQVAAKPSLTSASATTVRVLPGLVAQGCDREPKCLPLSSDLLALAQDRAEFLRL